MWRKHAVWCQCAAVMPAVMAMATVLSIQTLTWTQDLYWSILFTIEAVIQLIVAEHGTVIWNASQWQTIELKRIFATSMILWLWHTTQWPISQHFISHLVIFAATFWKRTWDQPQWHITIYGALSLYVILFKYQWSILTLLTMAKAYEQWLRKKLPKKSMASPYMRWIYGTKATTIVLESLCLWGLRCAHRFPYTMRWTPVWLSIITIGGACLWCVCFVKDTHISRNAIFKCSHLLHMPAASMIAAKACPECQTCLTALDMESSFGE